MTKKERQILDGGAEWNEVKLMRSYNLSKTMLDVINQMRDHDGTLTRMTGGFWTYEGVQTTYCRCGYDSPEWHCGVKTLRALEDRGLIELDEIKEIAKLK
jgi:hypothetical protein